jgi:hypothetical protein
MVGSVRRRSSWGLGIAGLGLGVSVLFVRETKGHVALESSTKPDLRWRTVFARTTFRDRSLSTASHAGLVNNLNDRYDMGSAPSVLRLAWSSDPPRTESWRRPIRRSGALGQVGTRALSDRIGRKRLIVGGMLLQAPAIGLNAAARPSRSG